MAAQSPESASLALELASEAASVGEARRAAGELARRLGADEHAVELAVSEAVTNCVVHAFRQRKPGKITLEGKAEDGYLLVVVRDDGGGMSPNLDSPGLGLGLSLIAKSAVDVSYDSSDAGTSVTMRFEAR
jgi:serine/threonine-protein kinase RsbW/stage II sporulation protein AB (anti-sigma F factor)